MELVTRPRLNSREWGNIVQAWNGIYSPARRARWEECRVVGHDWVDTDIDKAFCRRCCAWRDAAGAR